MESLKEIQRNMEAQQELLWRTYQDQLFPFKNKQKHVAAKVPAQVQEKRVLAFSVLIVEAKIEWGNTVRENKTKTPGVSRLNSSFVHYFVRPQIKTS